MAKIKQKPNNLPVAQLDRATDSDSVGRRFESCRVGQKNAGGFILPAVFLFIRLVQRTYVRCLASLRSKPCEASLRRVRLRARLGSESCRNVRSYFVYSIGTENLRAMLGIASQQTLRSKFAPSTPACEAWFRILSECLLFFELPDWYRETPCDRRSRAENTAGVFYERSRRRRGVGFRILSGRLSVSALISSTRLVQRISVRCFALMKPCRVGKFFSRTSCIFLTFVV